MPAGSPTFTGEITTDVLSTAVLLPAAELAQGAGVVTFVEEPNAAIEVIGSLGTTFIGSGVSASKQRDHEDHPCRYLFMHWFER